MLGAAGLGLARQGKGNIEVAGIRSDTACAILIRERPTHEWMFCTYTECPSVAERSAQQMVDQEHLLGREKFQARIMRRSDYDGGRMKARSKTFK